MLAPPPGPSRADWPLIGLSPKLREGPAAFPPQVPLPAAWHPKSQLVLGPSRSPREGWLCGPRCQEGSAARCVRWALVSQQPPLGPQVPPGGNKTQYEEIGIPVALLSHKDVLDVFKVGPLPLRSALAPGCSYPTPPREGPGAARSQGQRPQPRKCRAWPISPQAAALAAWRCPQGVTDCHTALLATCSHGAGGPVFIFDLRSRVWSRQASLHKSKRSI